MGSLLVFPDAMSLPVLTCPFCHGHCHCTICTSLANSRPDRNDSRFAVFPQKTEKVTLPSYPRILLTRHCTVVNRRFVFLLPPGATWSQERLTFTDEPSSFRRFSARPDMGKHYRTTCLCRCSVANVVVLWLCRMLRRGLMGEPWWCYPKQRFVPMLRSLPRRGVREDTQAAQNHKFFQTLAFPLFHCLGTDKNVQQAVTLRDAVEPKVRSRLKPFPC